MNTCVGGCRLARWVGASRVPRVMWATCSRAASVGDVVAGWRSFAVRFRGHVRGVLSAYNGQRTDRDMGIETMTDAQRVAANHADTLQRFGEWLEMFGEGASRRDVEIVADDDDADTDDRAAARAALEWIDENGADDLSWLSFAMGFLDCEISGRFDSDSGEWYVTDVAALVTCGGPNVRYHVHGNGTIRVSVAWWNDHADRVIESGLAGYLDEYADDVAGSRSR